MHINSLFSLPLLLFTQRKEAKRHQFKSFYIIYIIIFKYVLLIIICLENINLASALPAPPLQKNKSWKVLREFQ